MFRFLSCSRPVHQKFQAETNVNRLSANPTKWTNILKQFVGNSSVFDHFVGLALKESIKTFFVLKI